MPSDVSIRRFSGLVTESPNIEGEVNELIQAKNAIFENSGILAARPGFHYFSNPEDGAGALYYLGFTLFGHYFAGSNGYYKWLGDKDAPNLEKIGIITVTASARASNVVTLTVPSGHGIVAGDFIFVDVATASFEGQQEVTSVTATTILYNNVGINESGGVGDATLLPFLVEPSILFNRGVNYNGSLYLPNGKVIGALDDISDVAGFPNIVGGSKGCGIVVHAERLWFLEFSAGTTSSRVYFTEPGDPDNWPAANFIDVEPGDIWSTDIRAYQGRLYIFKENNIWVLDTPGVPTTWVLRKFSNVGSSFSMSVEYDGVMYWVNIDGVYSYNGSIVEELSDPILGLFHEGLDSTELGFLSAPVYSVVFRNNFVFWIRVGLELHCLCFHVKLKQWTEWFFDFIEDLGNVSPFRYNMPISIFTTEPGRFSNSVKEGMFIVWSRDESNSHAQLTGTQTGQQVWDVFSGDRTSNLVTLNVDSGHEMAVGDEVVVSVEDTSYNGRFTIVDVTTTTIEYAQTGVNDLDCGVGTVTYGEYWTDELGTRITGDEAIIPKPYQIELQTKYSDYGDAYNQKRAIDWAVEFEGGDVLFEQVDTRGVAVSRSLNGSGIVDRTDHQKARGFGYFRRLSIRMTISNFRLSGFRLYGLYGRMKVKGKQITNKQQVSS